MRPAAYPIDGLLVVDKPAGWTSHDVVARMRRLTGVRRIGHAGTLDPLATGVLPLGIGQGTRVLEYAGDADKVYFATVRLGASTDTYDADGRVTEEGDASMVTEEEARAALASFVGTIEQRPPAYSAIKQGGVRVHCSKGTYVRSIAHDLGERLGCGAHLAALRRLRSGAFAIEQATTLERFEAALADGSWPARILPLDAPLLDRPAVILDRAAAARLADGVAPPEAGLVARDVPVRAYDPDGILLAVLRTAGERGWRAEKVLMGHPDAAAGDI